MTIFSVRAGARASRDRSSESVYDDGGVRLVLASDDERVVIEARLLHLIASALDRDRVDLTPCSCKTFHSRYR